MTPGDGPPAPPAADGTRATATAHAKNTRDFIVSLLRFRRCNYARKGPRGSGKPQPNVITSCGGLDAASRLENASEAATAALSAASLTTNPNFEPEESAC